MSAPASSERSEELPHGWRRYNAGKGCHCATCRDDYRRHKREMEHPNRRRRQRDLRAIVAEVWPAPRPESERDARTTLGRRPNRPRPELLKDAEELRGLRAQVGVSQAVLAERLGVASTTVWKWEKALRTMPEGTLTRVRQMAGAVYQASSPLCIFDWPDDPDRLCDNHAVGDDGLCVDHHA